MTSSGELRLWFEVAGDMSLGELQDPALSVLGLTRQAATDGVAEGVDAETRAFQPVSVDLDEADRHRFGGPRRSGPSPFENVLIIGSAKFDGVPAADQVFFRYGGGYSPCPVAVERVPALPLTEQGVLPACVSRFNGAYFCTVLSAKIMSTGEAHLAFTVVGDMSMGRLQKPSCSKLSWRPVPSSPGGLAGHQVVATPAEVRLEWNENESRISGTLVYRGVPLEQDVCFAFGSSGYNKARVCFELLPSVVLTLSAVRGPDDVLVVSCTSMAGAEVASVDAGDLEPEDSIGALRRLLVGRLNVHEGQLTLIMPDGALLGAEHNMRLLDEVF